MKKDISKRIGLIDTLRGFALINMVLFHFLYDVLIVYGIDIGWNRYAGVIAWERFICISFILLSGVSLNFSRHPYKRGIIINLCGFLITLVTAAAMPSQEIWFGILNLIGCSMLICAALRPFLDRINPVLGAALSLIFYAVFYGVPERYIGIFNYRLFTLPDFLYSFKYAAFIGFPSADFRSADYFPLIKWIFVFLLGYFLWHIIERYTKQKILRRGFRPLSFIGRHSLVIYMVHQPILMGICFLIFGYI